MTAKHYVGMLALILAFATSACVNSGVQLTADRESGQRLYRSLCASCHGPQGRGDGPVAPGLVVPPSDLTLIAKRRNGIYPVEDLRRIIDGRFDERAHGTREMPVWGQRMFFSADPNDRVARAETEARISWLIEYLRTLQQP